MAVGTYSKKIDGDKLLSEDFKVREMACNDGSDAILIDTNLIAILQKVRNWAGNIVFITSGYRNAAYNAKVGGASNSYHVKGKAADIVVTGKTSTQVAAFLESIGVKGVMDYQTQKFTHVDTRTTKYWAKVVNGVTSTVSTFGGSSVAGPSAENNKEVEDVTEKRVQEMIDNSLKTLPATIAKAINETLTGDGTIFSEWFQREFTEEQVYTISDGKNPGGYTTREQTMAMILRSKED